MLHEKILLPVNYRDKGINNSGFQPYIKTYILDNFEEFSLKRKRPLVLICPGGAYGMHSQRESEAVAIKMNEMGFHACILSYSLAPMMFPASLLDLCEAMNYIRSHIEEWNIIENKIVVAGFSAGGHLTASLGVYWNSNLIKKYLDYPAEMIKPNGLMLAYPVITAKDPTHRDSIVNVLGDTKEYTEDDVSLEKLVSKDVPPVFMWHTDEDDFVPIEGAFEFAYQCRKQKIPLEFHVFRRGCHGLSLATEETCWPDGNGVQMECSLWPSMFANWMKSL